MHLPPKASAPRTIEWVAGVLLAVVLLVSGLIRWRLLDFPLERDEGEYAYAGQLMLDGVPPYLMAYNMKFPGTHAAYALIMAVFGETTAGIHIGLILVTLATAVLVFRLARRICGDVGGAVAAGTYALLSISPPTLGLAAHATHFVMLPAIGGILLVQNLGPASRLWQLFAAGLLIGISLLMKQAGAAFGIFAAFWVVRCELEPGCGDWRRLASRLGSLAFGGMLPAVLMCAVLWTAGVFDQFWHWTIEYAGAYASLLSPSLGMALLAETASDLFGAAPGLWGLGLLGLLLMWFTPSMRPWRAFVAGFTVFSFVAVCPGWYFRGHYFLLFIPATALLAGIAVRAVPELLARAGISIRPMHAAIAATIMFGLAGAQSLWAARAIFFQLSPTQACRAVYGANPFPESVEVAKFITSHCPPDASIAVIGSEPQIYFYSDRRSATGYIYTYALMEPQPFAVAMQEEMIREIEKGRPRFLVFVSVPTSWLQRQESHRRIFEWLDAYTRQLRLVAFAEILSMEETRYTWSLNGKSVTPGSNFWIAVFENTQAR